MAIRIVQLGSKRSRGEGLRIGTVRRPPRGIRKIDYSAGNFFDVWYPSLSPSTVLLNTSASASDTKSWAIFARKFLAEMRKPEPSRMLDLLAALSHQTNMAIGCYCADESRCHRSLLRLLLTERGADLR